MFDGGWRMLKVDVGWMNVAVEGRCCMDEGGWWMVEFDV
jgi:hypothetical protein